MYFGPDIEMDEEEERVMTAASRRSKDHLVGRPPVPPQPPPTSRGKAFGPHSLKQQRPSTSHGKGKRRASCPPSLQPSAKGCVPLRRKRGMRRAMGVLRGLKVWLQYLIHACCGT